MDIHKHYIMSCYPSNTKGMHKNTTPKNRMCIFIIAENKVH